MQTTVVSRYLILTSVEERRTYWNPGELIGNLVEGTPCEVIFGHVAHSRRFRVLPFVPSEDLRSSGSSTPPPSYSFLRNSKPVLDAHFRTFKAALQLRTTPLALPGFLLCWLVAVELAAVGARCWHNFWVDGN
jgi:hypothetical protein